MKNFIETLNFQYIEIQIFPGLSRPHGFTFVIRMVVFQFIQSDAVLQVYREVWLLLETNTQHIGYTISWVTWFKLDCKFIFKHNLN